MYIAIFVNNDESQLNMSTTFYTDLKYVTLLSSMPLDGKPIGSIFGRLIENDLFIADNFTNVIGIWQCNWYYDKNVAGYPKGYLCWLNTENPQAFIKKNYDIIQEYTDLNSKIINKLPDFDQIDDEILSAYYNAMTGYTDPTVGIIDPLEPIFDIGDYTKGPQLVVSLKDNNKELTTNRSAWKPLFIDDVEGNDKIEKIVSDFSEKTLSIHMLQYHLSGHEDEILNSLSNYIDEFSEKKHITKLNSKFYIFYSSGIEVNNGVDYVVNYVRKPYKLSGNVSEYQAFRQWKSGLIEHFGTISKENSLFRLSNDYLMIPFVWKYVGTGSTKAYEYGGISKKSGEMLSVSESENNQVSPLDNFINATFTRNDYSIENSQYSPSFYDINYSITISPVFQNLSGIPENYLDARFSTDSIETKWNQNFLINSLDSNMKTKDYCVMNLANSRIISPYISYYAIGKKG